MMSCSGYWRESEEGRSWVACTLKCCSNVVRNKNILCRPRDSPIHSLLPRPKAKKLARTGWVRGTNS